MAAPQVAGCTALLLELTAGRLWNDDVKDILLSTADPASANADGRLGAGYLNIERAVDVAQQHADRWRRGRGGFIEMGTGRSGAIEEATTRSGLPALADTGQKAGEEAEECRCRGADGMFGKVEFETAHTDPSHDPSPVGSCELKRYNAGAMVSADTDFSETDYADAFIDELDSRVRSYMARQPREDPLLGRLVPQSPIDGGVSADRLFRTLTRGIPVEGLQVVAWPGEVLERPLHGGDLLLRVAVGEPSLGHIAVLVDGLLQRRDALAAAGFRLEQAGQGKYAHIIDAGAFPHMRLARFARLVLDASDRLPPGQLLLRSTLEDATVLPTETTAPLDPPQIESSEAGAVTLPFRVIDENDQPLTDGRYSCASGKRQRGWHALGRTR